MCKALSFNGPLVLDGARISMTANILHSAPRIRNAYEGCRIAYQTYLFVPSHNLNKSYGARERATSYLAVSAPVNVLLLARHISANT